MTALTVSLSDEAFERLRAVAVRAGWTPEEVARLCLEEWLAERGSDFVAAAEYVLSKNAELYRRLGSVGIEM